MSDSNKEHQAKPLLYKVEPKEGEQVISQQQQEAKGKINSIEHNQKSSKLLLIIKKKKSNSSNVNLVYMRQ